MLLALLAFDSTAPAQTSSLRWAGLVNEATILDNGEVFAVEGGGRIRHRDTSGMWTFQATPSVSETLLRRVFALDTGTGIRMFAVGIDGRLLQKIGSGPWTAVHQQQETATGLSGPADLWDVHFVSATAGYTLGLHGIWRVDGHPAGTWFTAKFFEGQSEISPVALELYAFDFAPDGTALASAQPGMIFKQRTNDLDKWDLVFDLTTLCHTNEIPKCVEDNFCLAGIPFELWDLEISRHPTQPLALSVGGVGTGCGLVLASYDNGATWSVEPHECQCQFTGCTQCGMDPAYKEDPNPLVVDDTWRLRFFRELYNVAIFHGDNSAVVSGYNGQVVVRDPDADPITPGNQPVWRDRSVYSNKPLDAPTAVTLPGYGVAANGGTASNGIAYVTSMGGYIRRTSDGGQTWVVEAQPQNPNQAEPWRVRDVAFRNTDEGWMVTQFNRIARTTDGGETWTQDNSAPALNKPFLKAIALDGSREVGVAVGQFESNGTSSFPTVLFNVDLTNSTLWSPPASIVSAAGVTDVATEFHDVDWVNGQEFWAVGRGGLIVYSDPTVGLDLWRQYVPPSETYATFSDFDIDGVAFATSGHGVLVGSRIVDTKLTGKAYHAERVGTTINWTEIPIPGEASLRALTDVDFDGATAYATGTRDVVGAVQGVVLKATLSGGVFSDFVAVAQTFSECAIGDAATSVPILTEVEIAPGGAIWVGGQCGKLWKSTDGGVNWISVPSQSDAHVRGMSFPAADTGFIACHRQNRSGHCVLRILP